MVIFLCTSTRNETATEQKKNMEERIMGNGIVHGFG